ncbi:hypothetical protein B0I35DRAFT_413321 [Stachybotrys elegans]|uniref:Uncharacterized protein n=1 Tax=Stachybotrys elegans TaxID=80388 RepID=A0A8K0SMG0_9HYPO|nr:hypothetical protein B0I35DRAFT_413321 [Stachybotrys elegans]
MSASQNPDAMTPAQGEFRSRVAPSEPLTRKGHAPGVKVGNDAVPEFHAETYPPGTAPANQSFNPNPTGEVPGQALNPDMDAESRTRASDTLGGATSSDVHTGYGHPGAGMTSQELHGGKHKRERAGLEGVGANPSDPVHERGFDRDYPVGYRGKFDENYPGAEERIPAGPEEVASER